MSVIIIIIIIIIIEWFTAEFSILKDGLSCAIQKWIRYAATILSFGRSELALIHKLKQLARTVF